MYIYCLCLCVRIYMYFVVCVGKLVKKFEDLFFGHFSCWDGVSLFKFRINLYQQIYWVSLAHHKV